MHKDAENGPLVVITLEESVWYRMYVSNFYLLESPHMQEKFCVCFRLPYPNFRELVEWVSADPLFDHWCGWKSNNKKTLLVNLLVLGALLYLGQGWTFDDVEECTAISKEVHRVFFHKFILFGSTELYRQMVLAPISVDKALSHMVEYASAGLPGCIGSIDCTHIVTKQCEYNLKNNHLGFKSSNTTCIYNLTCNHHRRILHSTWNDQTMVPLDKFIGSVRAGTVFGDHEFELESIDREFMSSVTTVT